MHKRCPKKSARFNFVINAPFIQKVLIFLFHYKVHILRLIVEHNIRQMSPTTPLSCGGQQCAHFKSCALVGTPPYIHCLFCFHPSHACCMPHPSQSPWFILIQPTSSSQLLSLQQLFANLQQWISVISDPHFRSKMRIPNPMKYLYYALPNRRITVTVTGTWKLPSPILKYFHSIRSTKEHNNKSHTLHTCQSKYEPSICRMRKISDNYTITSSRQYKRGSGIYKVKS